MAYSHDEIAQIEFIQNTFKTILGTATNEPNAAPAQPLPERLKTEIHTTNLVLHSWSKTTAINPATQNSFHPNHWTSRLTRGSSLSLFAEDIIGKVCEYQLSRSQRKFGNGDPGDPTNLLFEEIKEWAVQISGKTINEAVYKEIIKRMQYIKLIEDSNLFPPGKSSAITTVFTLCRIRGKLKEMSVLIKQTLDERTAASELDVLVTNLQGTLEHGIQFLSHILNNQPEVAIDCTIASINNPATTVLQNYLQTNAGQCLKRLVETPEFKTQFGSPLNRLASAHSANSSRLFILDETKSPGAIQASPSIVTTLQDKQTNTGIYSPFMQDPEILEVFVCLHGLLQKLAEFRLHCDSAKNLAGDGGNLIIYGISRQAIINLMRGFITLNEAIIVRVDFLSSKAEHVYRELLRRGEVLPWMNHYRLATTSLELMQNELESCLARANNMHSKACIGISPKRQAEIIEATRTFINNANAFFSETLAWTQQSTSPPSVAQGATQVAEKAYEAMLAQHDQVLAKLSAPLRILASNPSTLNMGVGTLTASP